MSKKSKHKPKGPRNPPQSPSQKEPPVKEEPQEKLSEPKPADPVPVEPKPSPIVAPVAEIKPEIIIPEAKPAQTAAADLPAETPVKPKRNRGNRKKKHNDQAGEAAAEDAEEKPQDVKPVEVKDTVVKPPVPEKVKTEENKSKENVGATEKSEQKQNKKGGKKNKNAQASEQVPQQPILIATVEEVKVVEEKKVEIVPSDIQENKSSTPVDESKDTFIEAKSGKNKKSKNKKNKENKESQASESTPIGEKQTEIQAEPIKDPKDIKTPVAETPVVESPKTIQPETLPAVSEIEAPEKTKSDKKNKKGKKNNQKPECVEENKDQIIEPQKTPEIKEKVEPIKKPDSPKSVCTILPTDETKSLPVETPENLDDDILPSLASSIEKTLEKLIVCESDIILDERLRIEEENKKKLADEAQKAALEAKKNQEIANAPAEPVPQIPPTEIKIATKEEPKVEVAPPPPEKPTDNKSPEINVQKSDIDAAKSPVSEAPDGKSHLAVEEKSTKSRSPSRKDKRKKSPRPQEKKPDQIASDAPKPVETPTIVDAGNFPTDIKKSEFENASIKKVEIKTEPKVEEKDTKKDAESSPIKPIVNQISDDIINLLLSDTPPTFLKDSEKKPEEKPVEPLLPIAKSETITEDLPKCDISDKSKKQSVVQSDKGEVKSADKPSKDVCPTKEQEKSHPGQGKKKDKSGKSTPVPICPLAQPEETVICPPDVCPMKDKPVAEVPNLVCEIESCPVKEESNKKNACQSCPKKGKQAQEVPSQISSAEIETAPKESKSTDACPMKDKPAEEVTNTTKTECRSKPNFEKNPQSKICPIITQESSNQSAILQIDPCTAKELPPQDQSNVSQIETNIEKEMKKALEIALGVVIGDVTNMNKQVIREPEKTETKPDDLPTAEKQVENKQSHKKKSKKNTNDSVETQKITQGTELQQVLPQPEKEEIKLPDPPKPDEKIDSAKLTEPKDENKQCASPKPSKRSRDKKNKQGKAGDGQSNQQASSQQSQQTSEQSGSENKQGGESDKNKDEKKQDKGDSNKDQGDKTKQAENKDTVAEIPGDQAASVSKPNEDSFEFLKIPDSALRNNEQSKTTESKDKNKPRRKTPPNNQPKNLLGPSSTPVKSNKLDYKKEKDKDPETDDSEFAKVKMRNLEARDMPELIEENPESDSFLAQGTLPARNKEDNVRIFEYENKIDDDDEEEFVYKYSFRTVFIANACHVCKLPLKDDRVVCRFCHLVGYCNEKHRDDDWTLHQSLCYGVSTLANAKGQTHIYEDAKSLNGNDYRLLRMQAIVSCEKLLKRKLCPWEQEVLLYPRICSLPNCREWRSNLLKDCDGCGQVSYCAKDTNHLPAEHANWCRSYKLYHKLVAYQLNHGRLEPQLPDKIAPQGYLLPDKGSSLFNDLYGDQTNLEDCHFATLTQLSTAPLTTLYAYQKAMEKKIIDDKLIQEPLNGVDRRLTPTKSFCVHLIGAELQFEGDTLKKWESFFLHLVVEIKELLIVFIGPELNTSKLPVELLSKIKLCQFCRQTQRKIKFEFVEGMLYHDYVESEKFTRPDIICAFNPGFHRATGYAGLDTWPETIASALRLHVPLCVSAYTAHEMPRDLERVRRCAPGRGPGPQIYLAPGYNPYSSLRPDRNFVSDDEMPLIFKNYHMMVVSG